MIEEVTPELADRLRRGAKPGQPASITPQTDAAVGANGDVTPEFAQRLIRGPTMASGGFDTSLMSISPSGQFAGMPRTAQAMAQEPLLRPEAMRTNQWGAPIPIDIAEPGKDPLFYMAARYMGTAEKQVEWINSFSPALKPRVHPDTGDVLITLPASQNKPERELLLNPRGIDAYDVMDLIAIAPELGAAAASAFALHPAGAIAKGGPMLGKRLIQIAASALAGQTAGAQQDALARVFSGLEVDIPEIALRRGGQALGDMIFDMGLGAGAKAFGILSPFARRKTPIQINQDKARELFAQAIGEMPTQTPFQRTGSQILGAMEAVHAGMLHGGPFEGIFDAQREAVFRMRNLAAGIPTGAIAPASEEVGEKAIESVTRNLVSPVEATFRAAQDDLRSTGNAEVVKVIDDLLGMGPMGPQGDIVAGKAIREARAVGFAEAKKAADDAYTAVKKLPGGEGDVLSGDYAADVAKEIRKELPKVVKEVDVTEEVVSGFPLTKTAQVVGTEEVEEQLKSGVPAGLLQALDDLEALRGSKVSLQTFRNMRQAAFNKIAETQAVPGVKDRWFSMVADAYKQGMNRAVEQIDDGALKAAMLKANQTYIEKVIPWDRQAIAGIPRTEFEGGYIPDEQLIARLVGGPEAQYNWRTLKDALGENSPAIKQAKRAIVDDLITKSTDTIRDQINPEKFESLLKSFVDQNKVLAGDVFQGQEKKLFRIFRSMSWADDNTLLDAEEVRFLINNGNITAKSLERLRDAAIGRAKRYSNRLVKDVADGFPISSKISPMEFVSQMQNLNVPAKDVSLVLDTIARDNPALRDQIATVTMHNLFEKAEYTVQGKQRLSVSAIMDMVGGPNSDKRNRLELLAGQREVFPGATRMKAVDALSDYLFPEEIQFERFFRTGGSLAGQTIAAQAIPHPFKTSEKWAYRLAMAHLYTRPYAMKLIANDWLRPERTAALATALIGSEPFIDEMINIVGTDGATAVVKELKGSVDRWLMDFFEPEQSPRSEPTPTP